MSKGALSDEEMEKVRRCKEKLYTYSIKAGKDFKMQYFENKKLKNEVQDKADRIKKLEHDVARHTKAMSDLKTSFTMKLCETEKQLKSTEEMCKKLTKEKDDLKVRVEDSQHNYISLLEENKRFKEAIDQHKATIDAMMKEAKHNQGKTEGDIHLLAEEVKALRGTVQKAKKGLKLSLEWLLRFGDGLLKMGYLTEEDEGIVRQYHVVYKNFDKTAEKECFNMSSEVASTPSDAIQVKHIPAVSSKAHCLALSSNQAVIKVDAATSTVGYTSHIVDTGNSAQNKPEDDISSEGSDDDSSDSMHGYEHRMRNFDFLNEKLSPLPSSPVHVGQKSSSSSNKPIPHDPKCPVSSDKVTDELPLFLPDPEKGSYLPSEGFNTGLNIAQNIPKIDKRLSSEPVSKFTLSHTCDEQPELFMTFPLNQGFKQQSVNLYYDKDRVVVGYKPFPKDAAKHSAYVESEDESGCEKDLGSKRAKTSHNNSSYVHSRKKPMHQKLRKAQRRSITSVTQGINFDNCSENLSSVQVPVDKESIDKEKNAVNNSDSDQECVLVCSNTDSGKPTDLLSKVINALTNLEALHNEKSLHESMTEYLKIALSDILNKQQPSLTKSAVESTVGFLCSRQSNPLSDFMQNKKENVLLPLDEASVVKAYGMLGNHAFLKQLLDTIRVKLLAELNTLPLLSSAALCRAFSSLQMVGNNLEPARRLCYDLLKKNSDIAPYLVASVTSVYPEVLQKLPTNGSGELISIVIAYLTSTKPSGLEFEYWQQATAILQKNNYFSDVETPEAIAELIFNAIEANSKADGFSEEDVFNYTTAVELLVSRANWTWTYDNIVKKKIFPILKGYAPGVRRRTCGAVGLGYKLITVIASAHDKDGICLEHLKKTVLETLGHSKRVPRYILRLAYQALYYLYPQHSQDIDIMNWAKEHGLYAE